jgi:hypothetical protein
MLVFSPSKLQFPDRVLSLGTFSFTLGCWFCDPPKIQSSSLRFLVSSSSSSSCLELNHPVARNLSAPVSQTAILPAHQSVARKKKISPVGPLLVQHAVAALLAADGVALLQRDLVVAVAAQVVHRARRVFETAAARLEACVNGARGAAAGSAEVCLAGAGRGGLVLFAGHGWCVCVCVLCGGGGDFWFEVLFVRWTTLERWN